MAGPPVCGVFGGGCSRGGRWSSQWLIGGARLPPTPARAYLRHLSLPAFLPASPPRWPLAVCLPVSPLSCWVSAHLPHLLLGICPSAPSRAVCLPVPPCPGSWAPSSFSVGVTAALVSVPFSLSLSLCFFLFATLSLLVFLSAVFSVSVCLSFLSPPVRPSVSVSPILPVHPCSLRPSGPLLSAAFLPCLRSWLLLGPQADSTAGDQQDHRSQRHHREADGRAAAQLLPGMFLGAWAGREERNGPLCL